MSKCLATVGVCAVMLFCSMQQASATVVSTPQEAEKEFKNNTKFNLGEMKTFLKDTLATFKTTMAGIKSDLADGTLDPFAAAALVATAVQDAFESASLSLSTHAGAVDTAGSSFISQVPGNPIFSGVRHGEGGTLDKFVAGAKKELDKFAVSIGKELAKIRKAFVKNDGSFTNIKFIASVQPFPRSFDPTPALGTGNLNGSFLNAFLAGIAVIDLAGTRQDIFVVGMCRVNPDVQFRQGNDAGAAQGALIPNIGRVNGIFGASLTNQATIQPLFADGFETGTAVAFSNTVP